MKQDSASGVVPKHVAIIMDGNGRWAERRFRPRIYGHVRGCRRVLDIIREADRLGVQALTLFAFSTENWARPFEEVNILMKLLKKWLIREQRELMEKNIKVRTIGAIHRLPAEVRAIVEDTVERSKNNTGLQLTLALSYGGREEITQAARRLAMKVAAGDLDPKDINEKAFANELSTTEIGDPDLLIRTSGEERISNFLLWQVAYTELYFTETMWPDFSPSEFKTAVAAFMARQRRFGMTSKQIEQAAEVRVH